MQDVQAFEIRENYIDKNMFWKIEWKIFQKGNFVFNVLVFNDLFILWSWGIRL